MAVLARLYDPFDAAVHDDPYPIYRVLRDEHPVYRSAPGRPWVLSRYDDVDGALRNPGTYSSAKGIFPTPPGVDMTDLFLPMMIMMDPPQHTDMRTIVSRAFTPRRIAGIEESVRTLADELLDDLTRENSGDVVTQLAGPLPAMVIADLLGIPRADREQFRAWSSTLVQSNPAHGTFGPGLTAAASLYEYFAGFLQERRRAPQDDLLSALVAADVQGQQLTDEEVLGFCLLLLVAGHETTTNLLGNAAVVLAEHPDARRAMADDPATIAPAVEELLRYDSPVQGLSRTLTTDVTLHDTRMDAGDTVLLLFGSANRDGRAFPDPDTFDIARRSDRQVAFGHGIHFCLGASLARVEARIALGGLLSRIPDWQVDPDNATRLRSGPIRGYSALPLTW